VASGILAWIRWTSKLSAELLIFLLPPSISADSTGLASNQFPASPPRSLTAMSPTEVHAIATPRNPRAFHHLSQSLTMDLQHSNSPRTWRISHAVGKLPNTGIAAIHERDYLQERLQVAAKRRREIANRNPGADDGSRGKVSEF